MSRALILCGFWICLRVAAAGPSVRCSGPSPVLCLFQNQVDFRVAEDSCSSCSGRLVWDQLEVLRTLPDGFSGRIWLRGSEGPSCAAVFVRSVPVDLSVPCRERLDGFVCQFESSEVCSAVRGSGLAQLTYTTTVLSTRFEVVGSDQFPPGTVAVEDRSGARLLDSKQLCLGTWYRAPWRCEVLQGGCEHGCQEGSNICTCPATHALHPNNFSCVARAPSISAPGPSLERDPNQIRCGKGFEPSEDWTECVDVDECADGEDSCTDEGEECVNIHGGFTCECKPDFEKEDGACVNISICQLCEHICNRISGEYMCACRSGFRVSPADPTRCEQHCSDQTCRAICVRDPVLEERDQQQCTCPEGYIVNIFNRTAECVDIDECEQQMCTQRCENTFGGYRCACEAGFRLEGEDRCVPLDGEQGEGPLPPSGSSGPLRPAVLPPYIKTGSILGIVVFLVLCVGLLGCLVRTMMRRCGRLDLTSIKHPDLDIFYLQQVTTETYKRLSFDKQSKTESLRL